MKTSNFDPLLRIQRSPDVSTDSSEASRPVLMLTWNSQMLKAVDLNNKAYMGHQ